ncbi:MAG: hypothetical protein WD533_08950 [Dehalococcoidia bacterium]
MNTAPAPEGQAAAEKAVGVPKRTESLRMGAAVAIAVAGSLIHNALEFGVPSVLAIANGEAFLVIPLVGAFLVWWRSTTWRGAAAWVLVVLAALNLIGGAVLTALPLGFLPFEPEQSWNHYLSHIVYGFGQVPLIIQGSQYLGKRAS